MHISVTYTFSQLGYSNSTATVEAENIRGIRAVGKGFNIRPKKKKKKKKKE